MRLDVLLGGLRSSNPGVRLDVVRVLGMLDETQALDALRQHYQAETDPNVRGAIAWAGKRLYEAQQAGYQTVNEVFRFFSVDREIETMPDANEAALLDKMQLGLNAELQQIEARAGARRAGMAIAAGIGGTLLAGGLVGAGMMAGALSPGATILSSNLGNEAPVSGRRTPATKPTNTDIAIWARRLREEKTEAKREKAAIELAQLNNPAALPHLAAAFVSDTSMQVRQTVQRFGKILYWSAVYWEMQEDGSLQQEMERRAAAIGKTLKSQPSTGTLPPPGTAPSAPPPPPETGDISDILRKAEAERARRQKK